MACYDISYLDKELKDCKFCGVKVAWTTNKAGKGYFCNVYSSNSEYKRQAGISVAYTHSLHKCDPKNREEYRELLGADHPDNKPKTEAPVVASKPVPDTEARITFNGTVEFLKAEDAGYGVQLKMRVVCDGFKLWGTVPTAIADVLQVGDAIQFNAKVQRSHKDESFGFFSRPSQAKIVASKIG